MPRNFITYNSSQKHPEPDKMQTGEIFYLLRMENGSYTTRLYSSEWFVLDGYRIKEKVFPSLVHDSELVKKLQEENPEGIKVVRRDLDA